MSVEDAVDTLSATGPALLKLVHTHDGAAVACAALGYGTAKDRKRIVKAMKGELKYTHTHKHTHTHSAIASSCMCVSRCRPCVVRLRSRVEYGYQ